MTTDNKFLNELMKYEFGDFYPVSKIFAIQPSKSTNSTYVLFKNENNNIFELAVSDHETDDRQKQLVDFYIDSDLTSDEYHGFIRKMGLSLNDDLYFNLKTLSGYKLFADTLEQTAVGAKSYDRAIVSNNYVAKKVDVLEGGMLLKVTYADDDIEYYTNEYYPFSNSSNEFSFDELDILRKFFDGAEIRRAIYNPRYEIITDSAFIEQHNDYLNSIKDDDERAEEKREFEHSLKTGMLDILLQGIYELDPQVEDYDFYSDDNNFAISVKYNK